MRTSLTSPSYSAHISLLLISLFIMCMPAATCERRDRSSGTPLRLRGGGGVLDTSRYVKRRDDRRCNAVRADGGFDVLFLGTGVSTAVPRIGCIVRPDQSQPVCKVCHDALRHNSRNRRGNVSILVRFWHADGRPRHIMVDAGKTMREQCIRLLPRHNIRTIDALLLTHEHADAILGLDDIRDFQQQGTRHLDWLPSLPVYLHQQNFDEIKRRFSYLVPGAGSALEQETAAIAAAAEAARRLSSRKIGEQGVGGGKGQREACCGAGHAMASTDADSTTRNSTHTTHNSIYTSVPAQVKANIRIVSKIDWRIIPQEEAGRFAPRPVALDDCDGLRVTALPVLHGGDLISLAFDFQAGVGEEADRDTSRGRGGGGGGGNSG